MLPTGQKMPDMPASLGTHKSTVGAFRRGVLAAFHDPIPPHKITNWGLGVRCIKAYECGVSVGLELRKAQKVKP